MTIGPQPHELIRKQVWSDAWSATASANDCKHPDTATEYADAALRAFDKRFPPPAASTDITNHHNHWEHTDGNRNQRRD